MKTIVLFVASMFFIHGICRAQDATPYEKSCQSQLFGEASGPGVGLSLNYEKLFWKAN